MLNEEQVAQSQMNGLKPVCKLVGTDGNVLDHQKGKQGTEERWAF